MQKNKQKGLSYSNLYLSEFICNFLKIDQLSFIIQQSIIIKMFFLKIMKQKQKHNLTLKLHKLSFSDTSKLQNGWYFKITVIRGNQKLDFTTLPIKKGQIKCKKQSHSVLMSLYYDQQTKKFLEKEIEVEGVLMNDLDETVLQLGNSVINITEYMSNITADKFVLEVQLNDQKNRACIIKFNVQIERVEEESKEDNKSVNTNERYPSSNQFSQNGEIKQPNKKQLTNNYKFKQITPSDTSSQKSMNLYQVQPPKSSQRQGQIRAPPSLPKEQMSQGSPFTTKKEKKNPIQTNLQPIESNQPLIPTISSKPSDNKSSKSPQKQIKKKKQSYQSVNQQPTQTEQSGQLKLYMYQKKLKQSQRKLEAAKAKIEDQKQIINRLLQEQNKTHVSSQMIKNMNEIQSLKAQLLKANLKIGQLQAQNRHLQSGYKQNMKIIDTKAKQASYYKQLLQNYKLKIGNLMQRCYESNDVEMMTAIEEELSDI